MVDFLGLHETRKTHLDHIKIRSMLGNSSFDFACSTARGNSGGILFVWDHNVLKKERVLCTENVVIVEGCWIRKNIKFTMINMHAPQHSRKNMIFRVI